MQGVKQMKKGYPIHTRGYTQITDWLTSPQQEGTISVSWEIQHTHRFLFLPRPLSNSSLFTTLPFFLSYPFTYHLPKFTFWW